MRGFDLLLAGPRPGDEQVVAQAGVEQVGVLRDHTNQAAQVACPETAQVMPGELDFSLLVIPQAQQQLYQRGFAGAAGPYHRQMRAGRQVEAQVVQGIAFLSGPFRTGTC